jgi:hypothetical protein
VNASRFRLGAHAELFAGCTDGIFKLAPLLRSALAPAA